MKHLFKIVLIALILSSCSGNSDWDDGTYEAQVNVEDYVTMKLRSPATASFENTQVEKIGKNHFNVTGTVDSQNGFGATVRSQFSCVIRFVDGGSRYVIEEFVIE